MPKRADGVFSLTVWGFQPYGMGFSALHDPHSALSLLAFFGQKQEGTGGTGSLFHPGDAVRSPRGGTFRAAETTLVVTESMYRVGLTKTDRCSEILWEPWCLPFGLSVIPKSDLFPITCVTTTD